MRGRPRFRPFSGPELALVKSLRRGENYLPRGRKFEAPAAIKQPIFTLTEGWAYGYSAFAGGTRSVIQLYLPGDVIGLVPIYVHRGDFTAIAITPVHYCILDGAALSSAVGATMLLSRLLAENSSRWQLRASHLALREPRQRVAYFLLDIFMRLRSVGIGDQTMCPFYLQRWQLAEANGISQVHLNRTLRELRGAGVLDLTRDILVIPDPNKLQVEADIAMKYDQTDQSIL